MNEYKLADIKQGMSHTFSRIITAELLDQFTTLSRDTSPLHTDDAFAKEHEFDSKLVHGLLYSSFLSELTGLYLPGKYGMSQGLNLYFHKPVYVNDELTVSGTILSVHEVLKHIETEAIMTNQEGEIVCRAMIRTGLLE